MSVFFAVLVSFFFLAVTACFPRSGRCSRTKGGENGPGSEPVSILDPREVPRRLPLAKGRNYRDLGGIRASDGRRIAPGRLFRTDDMHSLSPGDLDFLASIPITTVIDFRSQGEVARHPDKLPHSVKNHFIFPIVPGRLELWNPDELLRAKGGLGFMTDIYRSLILDDNSIDVYRDFFLRVQSEEHLPLLFHCSAGKDRTGMAAVFILLALGVNEETVMADYLDSNTCLAGKYDREIALRPERAPIFFADPAYLHAAVAAMEEKIGGVERYLTRVLGVDTQKMRDCFLCGGS